MMQWLMLMREHGLPVLVEAGRQVGREVRVLTVRAARAWVLRARASATRCDFSARRAVAVDVFPFLLAAHGASPMEGVAYAQPRLVTMSCPTCNSASPRCVPDAHHQPICRSANTTQ